LKDADECPPLAEEIISREQGMGCIETRMCVYEFVSFCVSEYQLHVHLLKVPLY
jgi:hypothetical protein